MFGFGKKKTWPYSYKVHSFEPNKYMIMKNKDWFMAVQFNGGSLPTYQKEKMEFLVECLNKGRR